MSLALKYGQDTFTSHMLETTLMRLKYHFLRCNTTLEYGYKTTKTPADTLFYYLQICQAFLFHSDLPTVMALFFPPG